jgi:tartrate-resistant acid phosphatase type 5
LRSILRLFPVLLFILLLSACSAAGGSIDNGFSRTPELQSTSTQKSTIAPSVTPVPITDTPTVVVDTPTPIASDTLIPTFTPTPETVVRFAVIGDYGAGGGPEADVSELVKSWDPDFIITTGDNNYPDGSQETIDTNIGQFYHEFIYPYNGDYGEGADRNRFYPSLGNHDWNTFEAQPYLDYFSLPGNERYYEFTWGPLHFFAVDSDSREPDGVGSSSIQAEWLRDALASSNAQWKIVYMHHTPYSSGRHGPVKWTRWPYQEWGASAVLSGHDHTYERIMVDGFPYFVNGLGGASKYSFKEIMEGSQVRYNADNGAMLIEADSSRITFQFIDRQGVLIDSYTIEKTE